MNHDGPSIKYPVDDPSIDTLTADVVDPDAPPMVSFCIPTLNDESTLGRFLESIEVQDYPQIEVIVVDGGSNDQTVEIAKEYGARTAYDEGTLGSARQTGFEVSTGDIVALFDADLVLPHDEWLREAVRRFNYDEAVSTVWPINVAPPDAPHLTRLYFDHWELIMEDRIVDGRGYFGGGNALFRRACLDDIGGIDADFHWGEDFDWARRLYEAGFTVVYHRDPVYHDTMRSLSRFARKQLVGAETFTDTGVELMGLTVSDVLYEQFVLGFHGMICGLLVERNPAWLWYPPYIGCRTGAYAFTYLRQIGRQTKKTVRALLPVG